MALYLKFFILPLACFMTLSISTGALSDYDEEDKSVGPDLSHVREMIKASAWTRAIEELRAIAVVSPHADVYNLMGFSLRQKGDYKASFANYQKALKLNPKHMGAHEYLGELYVKMGDITKAKEQANILAKLCPEGCEEQMDLEKVIAAASR